MHGGVCPVAQPEVERSQPTLALAAKDGVSTAAPPDALRQLGLTHAAGLWALGKVEQAVAALPSGERVRPAWALALYRLQELGRPVTIGQFQLLCVMDTNASYVAQRLVALGLVLRRSVPDDRRLGELELTPVGAAWLARLRAELVR